MNTVNKVSSGIDTVLKKINSNSYVSTIISLILVLYACLAAPKLPKKVAKIFGNNVFKAIFMFLIAYTASKDPKVAIISAVALLVSINTLTKYESNRIIKKTLRKSVGKRTGHMSEESELSESQEEAVGEEYDSEEHAGEEHAGEDHVGEDHVAEDHVGEESADEESESEESMGEEHHELHSEEENHEMHKIDSNKVENEEEHHNREESNIGGYTGHEYASH